MIEDVVIQNGLLEITIGTFVCMVAGAETAPLQTRVTA